MHSDAKIVPFSTVIRNAIMPQLLAPFDELNFASTVSLNKATHMAKERIRNKQDLQRVLVRYGVSEADTAAILKAYDMRKLPFLFGDDARLLAKQLTDNLYPVFIAMLQYITQTTYDRMNAELGGGGIAASKINTQWSGKQLRLIIYSTMVALLRKRNETFLRALFLGKNNEYIVDELRQAVNKTLNHTRTISRTEASQVVNTAILEALKDNGIEKYRFVATLDSRTSKQCRALHNRVFLVIEALRGLNFPPMHPNCRSVIAPEMDS